MSNHCECCERMIRFIRKTCCERMKAASDVKRTSSRYVGNSSSSRDGATQSSAGEGSDSDGSQKESSYCYTKSAKMPAIFSSEEFSGWCYLTEAEKLKIHALVEKIQSEIPVLVVRMKKTNVTIGDLVIYKDYALKYFPCEATNIILQLPSKNKEWKCRLYVRKSGLPNNAGRRNLYFGKFVRDNCVQEGDICLFQPISKVKEESFRVIVRLLRQESIHGSPGGRAGMAHTATDRRTCAKMALTARVKEEPATDGEDTSSLGSEEDGDNSEGASETPFILPRRASVTAALEQKVREKVEAIESTVPVYVAILNRSNVGYDNFTTFLTFGAKYASRYLNKNYGAAHHGKKNMISLVLQREGKSRTWNTELRRRVDRTSILKGWASFARSNRLREGDLCLFKLMESVEPLKMMVYIIRREKFLA
ncbi:B3 domain-containing protein Os03g0620400-like [Triticum dicoccoides]|uniref:B3 domain-containing protein Os03g0620400-like n=1 Tax=Triticum dicoccoides TaxID=85692 RepID=UPI00188E00A3|nr:B3 domain-containing protein Os03g0620400-like [Triticum dicoccoides]